MVNEGQIICYMDIVLFLCSVEGEADGSVVLYFIAFLGLVCSEQVIIMNRKESY